MDCLDALLYYKEHYNDICFEHTFVMRYKLILKFIKLLLLTFYYHVGGCFKHA